MRTCLLVTGPVAALAKSMRGSGIVDDLFENDRTTNVGTAAFFTAGRIFILNPLYLGC